MILVVFYWHSCHGEEIANTCPLDLRIELNAPSKELTVTLENNGQNDQLFFESIRVPERVPYFLTFMIQSKKDGVITKTDKFGNDHMSSLASSSDLIRMPVTDRMVPIRSGEHISRTVPVADLLMGTQRRWAVPPELIRDFAIRFRARVYCDDNFQRVVVYETDWYRFRNNRLLLDDR